MATDTLEFDPSTAKPMNVVERKAFAKLSLALAEELSANQEPLTRYERKHQYCFSFPDCEDFPTGCHHYSAEMGIEVEEFGHKD